MGRLTYEAKQIKLNNDPKIYFSKTIEINSLGDIIYNLFFTGSPTSTYHRIGENDAQTPQKTGGLRSIEDVYILATSYLGNHFTYRQVNDAVRSFHEGKKALYTIQLRSSYCWTVERLVHSRYSYSGNISAKTINNWLDSLNLNIYKYEEVQAN